MIKEDAKALKIGREETANLEPEKVKAINNTITTTTVEDAESKKQPTIGKERNIDLQLDLEKTDRDATAGNKLHQHVPRQPPVQQANNEKNGI